MIISISSMEIPKACAIRRCSSSPSLQGRSIDSAHPSMAKTTVRFSIVRVSTEHALEEDDDVGVDELEDDGVLGLGRRAIKEV